MVLYVLLGGFFSGLDPAWIALLGTICGGIGLKAVEHWLSRTRVKIDDAATIRNELRGEVTTLRAELAQAERDVDKWRKEYYDLRDEMSKALTELRIEKARHEE